MGKEARIHLTSLFFLLLLISQSTSARRLQQSNQGDAHTVSSPSVTTKEKEDVASLMGLEICNENDEACLNRRMIDEAHLDYIYTTPNTHKSKGSP